MNKTYRFKILVAVLLTLLVFSGGVIAGQVYIPDGSLWATLSQGQKETYIEGFWDGENTQAIFDDSYPMCREGERSNQLCLLTDLNNKAITVMGVTHEWHEPLYKTRERMKEFYARPENQPIWWMDAVVVVSAMRVGVPIDEKDLELLRRQGAENRRYFKEHVGPFP